MEFYPATLLWHHHKVSQKLNDFRNMAVGREKEEERERERERERETSTTKFTIFLKPGRESDIPSFLLNSLFN
jgi:hypothetical protein